MADSSSFTADVRTDAVDSTGETVISVTQSNNIESSTVDSTIVTGGTGPQGPQGEQGEQGEPGPQGPAGTGGVTDHTLLTNIGTNSHAQIDTHLASTSNPHSVSKSQVGLSNVDNTSDAGKPVSTAQQTALDGKANTSHTHVKANITDFAHTHLAADLPDASTTGKGIVELATSAETTAGLAVQASDTRLSDSRTPTSHTHGVSDLTATGTKDSTTILYGDNTFKTAPSGGAGVTDGDKGDITVSGTGATWTVDNDAITYAKIQNVSATDKVLGRSTAGAGDVEEISTTGSGNVVRATSPTLVTPALGTPASGVATNLTGTASGLTAGNVTTNANLTGHITSTGNATVLGSFTLAQLSTAVSDANVARTDAAQTFTGIQTMTSPAITTPTGIVKGDVGLGNVDNTSNATERTAVATLTNKTLTTPTIGDFTNANHTHTSVATGGLLTFSGMPAGNVVQVANTISSAVATGTTLIPLDDTLPQNTEGNEYMTCVITPKATTHTLVIEVKAMLANSAASNHQCLALFQDANVNAIAAAEETIGADSPATITLTHTMAAGTTAATTFRVRSGSNVAGTTTFNGRATGRLYGAIPKSSIVIYEYKS